MTEAQRPDEHLTRDVKPPKELFDSGKDLLALLSAYDEAQVGMTPEEKDAMNERVAVGDEDFTVSRSEMTRRRAGVEIARLQGATIGEGLRTVESLESASEQIPGLKGVLNLLARENNPGDSKGK